jgi:hypothetical protein
MAARESTANDLPLLNFRCESDLFCLDLELFSFSSADPLSGEVFSRDSESI